MGKKQPKSRPIVSDYEDDNIGNQDDQVGDDDPIGHVTSSEEDDNDNGEEENDNTGPPPPQTCSSSKPPKVAARCTDCNQFGHASGDSDRCPKQNPILKIQQQRQKLEKLEKQYREKQAPKRHPPPVIPPPQAAKKPRKNDRQFVSPMQAKKNEAMKQQQQHAPPRPPPGPTDPPLMGDATLRPAPSRAGVQPPLFDAQLFADHQRRLSRRFKDISDRMLALAQAQQKYSEYLDNAAGSVERR